MFTMLISPFSNVRFMDNILADAATSLTKFFQIVIACTLTVVNMFYYQDQFIDGQTNPS